MYGYVKWPPWMVGYTWVVYHLVSQSTWKDTKKGYGAQSSSAIGLALNFPLCTHTLVCISGLFGSASLLAFQVECLYSASASKRRPFMSSVLRHYQKGNDTSTTGPHDYSILFDIIRYIYIYLWYMFPRILSINKNKHVRRTFTNPVRSVLSLGPRLFLRHLPTVALHIRMGTNQHGTAPRMWAGHCLGGIYGNLVGVHGEWR